MIFLGAICSLPLLYAASCTPQDKYQLFHWFYSFAWAINAGLAYYAPCHHAWIFFPDKLGFASGVVLAGFGAGAIIFDNASTWLINPTNIPIGSPEFTKTVQERFKLMMSWLIFCWLCLVITGIILVW